MNRVVIGVLALIGSTCETWSQQPFVMNNPSRAAAPEATAMRLRASTALSPPISAPASPFALATPARAPNPLAQADAPGNRTPSAKQVNESALRYYASLDDVARVSIEIRRLQALHPGWQPPADLMSGSTSAHDEQPLWDLFAAGSYEDLQAKIAEIQADSPDWQPSPDLATKLSNALARRQMVAAFEAKQWGDVIDIAAQNNSLLVCADVDDVWRVAEALAQADDKEKAFDAYRYVLTNCANPQERLATVQKAAAFLAPSAVEALVAMGRRKSDGTSEFEAVKSDALRRKIGVAISDPAGAAPSQAELDTLARAAQLSNSSKDAQLLGWYWYARKDYAAAQTWFGKSLALDRDAKSAEGLALSLRAAGKLDEAEETAFTWRASGPDVRKVFIEIVSAQLTATPPALLSAERQSRFAQIVQDEKSPLGAQSLGWYLYNKADIAGAEGWFQKSVGWKPSEEAVVGLAISAKRNRDMSTFRLAIQSYRTAFPRVADLEKLDQLGVVAPAPRPVRGRGARLVSRGAVGASANPALALFQAGKYKEALAALERQKQRSGRVDPGLEVLRGWALYHSGDWAQARTVFADAAHARPKESNQGIMVIEAREQPRFRQ